MKAFLEKTLIKSWKRTYFAASLFMFFAAFHFLDDYLAVFILIALTAGFYLINSIYNLD